MNKKALQLAIISLSAGLVACGGSSNKSSAVALPDTTAGTVIKSFSDMPTEFLAEFSADKTSVCYDIETSAEVDCATTQDTWDVRFDNDFNIWLNGGIYGNGDAGAYGPQILAEMQAFAGGAAAPVFFKDQVSGIFLESSWYAYGVNGGHKLWPNYRVYVVESNNKHYKVRLTSYYAGADSNVNAGEAAPGTSGIVTFDYEEITDGITGAIVTKTIDASAGGYGASADDANNKYSYFSFASGDLVELTDEEAASSAEWDIAFKRTSTKLNSANSTQATQGALAAAQADFYAEDGTAITDKFLQATRETEQDDFDSITSSSIADLTFVKDGNKAVLGSDWYNYDYTTHLVTANTDNHWILRSASADNYAIFSMLEITPDGHSAESYKVNFYPEVAE